MSLTLELPTPLVEELTRAAKQRNVSPEEYVTRLVELVVALTQNGWDTPLRDEVKLFLSNRSVNADQVASVLGELVDSPLVPEAGRQARRLSARGRYAHLGISSEDVARSKRRGYRSRRQRLEVNSILRSSRSSPIWRASQRERTQSNTRSAACLASNSIEVMNRMSMIRAVSVVFATKASRPVGGAQAFAELAM